jgi:hypothetical protein
VAPGRGDVDGAVPLEGGSDLWVHAWSNAPGVVFSSRSLGRGMR